MKSLSPALQAHLDDGTTTLSWCWRISRTDGVTLGFTDHDRVLTFDGTAFEPETHFAGTGRSIDNEVFFNTAQKPLIESASGIFAMTEEGIAGNLEALAKVGIKGTREMFDTTLLDEI